MAINLANIVSTLKVVRAFKSKLQEKSVSSIPIFLWLSMGQVFKTTVAI